MASTQAYTSYYKQMEVQTADPFELVLILYKGAIDRLGQAKHFLQSGDIENRVLCLNKAAAMIAELQTALDFKNGGEIAVSLGRLYSYMQTRIAEANARKQVEPIDEVCHLLNVLLSAWEEAMTIRLQSQPTSVNSDRHVVAG